MSRTDTELFKDKIEVSLDGRQIFFLFFGGAVIACLVFVLGVMVGKRVEARAHVERSAATSAALDPLSALDQLGGEEEGDNLAFPIALTSGDEAADMPLGAVDEKLASAPAEPKRAGAKPESKRSAPDKPRKKVEAADARPKPPAKPKQETERAKEEPSSDKAAEKAASGGSGAEVVAAKPASAAKPAKRKHRYTLQLSSFQDREEADAFYGKLVGAGYRPYVVEANVPGKGKWFRVRLGSYDSYALAIEAKKDFEAKQKIIAYVTKVKR